MRPFECGVRSDCLDAPVCAGTVPLAGTPRPPLGDPPQGSSVPHSERVLRGDYRAIAQIQSDAVECHEGWLFSGQVLRVKLPHRGTSFLVLTDSELLLPGSESAYFQYHQDRECLVPFPPLLRHHPVTRPINNYVLCPPNYK